MPVLELGVRAFAAGFPGHLAELAELPRHLTAAVGGHRVAIVHGDPESLLPLVRIEGSRPPGRQ